MEDEKSSIYKIETYGLNFRKISKGTVAIDSEGFR